ncbi:histone-lysine n-methyltransferase setmar-like protein [Trichonephila clavipes]|nr:histone-lysine n-methyltransferase setmar-like protein [Trichonephila clavipes]
MDKMVVYKIISEDLGMRKIFAKLVPKVLTNVQKQNHETVSKDLLKRIEIGPHFFDNVITGDESWLFEYDPETKRQSNEWHTPQSPRQKKARMSKTDNQWCLLRGSVKKIEATGQPSEPRNFRQLEAPPQQCAISHLLRGYREVDKNGIVTIPQPPYSPDLAPADFFLFSKVKTAPSKDATTGPWMMSKALHDSGSPVVKVSDHGRHVMSSSTVKSRTRHEGER